MLVTMRHFAPVCIAQVCACVRLASVMERPAKETNFAR
jgi:hypothetical protein